MWWALLLLLWCQRCNGLLHSRCENSTPFTIYLQPAFPCWVLSRLLYFILFYFFRFQPHKIFWKCWNTPASQTASFLYFLLHPPSILSHLFSIDLTHPKARHKGPPRQSQPSPQSRLFVNSSVRFLPSWISRICCCLYCRWGRPWLLKGSDASLNNALMDEIMGLGVLQTWLLIPGPSLGCVTEGK